MGSLDTLANGICVGLHTCKEKLKNEISERIRHTLLEKAPQELAKHLSTILQKMLNKLNIVDSLTLIRNTVICASCICCFGSLGLFSCLCCRAKTSSQGKKKTDNDGNETDVAMLMGGDEMPLDGEISPL